VQEPPRLLPPEGAVPVTGRAPGVALGQAKQLRNPLPPTPDNLRAAADLYQLNCNACHGPNGHGDGLVAPYFGKAGVKPPADYASPAVRSLSEGEMYAVIENGLRGMPPWRNLLSSNERWLLVLYERLLSTAPR
jgi:mono/diheme cytochrome c family protein